MKRVGEEEEAEEEEAVVDVEERQREFHLYSNERKNLI